MGQHYQQLDAAERACIMLRLRDGFSSRAIARELNRSPSSITREIAKHHHMPGCAALPYEAGRAGMRAHMARFTRRRRRKLDPAGPLFTEARTLLKHGWSPDQIAGHLKLAHPDCYDRNVSHETIYTALYALPRGELRRELIDMPGMRELGLLGAGEGIDETFARISELARDCRFPDCRHGSEPGCAVRAAIERGELSNEHCTAI